MIELLGPRPFEKEDPYDVGVLGGPPKVPAPVVTPPRESAPLPLGEGIEAGNGVPVPHPVGVATSATKVQ